MTSDQLQELIYKHYHDTIKDPTTLIVEQGEFYRWVGDVQNTIMYSQLKQLVVDKIFFMGVTLRVIFATNLEEGEVIVL